MSTIQTSSALRVARVDLTTTDNTTLYTVPNRYDSIVESIIVSDDFADKSLIERHRMVYEIMGNLIQNQLRLLTV